MQGCFTAAFLLPRPDVKHCLSAHGLVVGLNESPGVVHPDLLEGDTERLLENLLFLNNLPRFFLFDEPNMVYF